MGGDSVPGFRGRTRELSVLTDAFDAAVSGSPTAVLVSGEAGVGKTRLATGLVEHARARGAVVLLGAAVDIADAPPFWPVLSAVRNRARSPADDPGVLLRRWLTRLREAENDRAGPPVQLLDLLYRLVVDLAGLSPVVLVIEDLQWADRSTRDLLTYLVANLVDERVVVVGTLRTDTPGRSPGSTTGLVELRRLHNVATLELAPLGRDVVAELVEDWAPGRPDLAQLVWQRSEGNAFFAEETVRAVLSGDARGLPPTLRELVLGRVALLSSAAQQVVRALATGVGPLPHRLLVDVLELVPDALHTAVREAMDHGVVGLDDARERYQLRHGLMAEVVAADLLPGERMDLHKRFALALARGEGRDSAPGLAAKLAHHWYEADDPDQALRASALAAQASETVHAHAEAHRHWMRAAELVRRVSPDSTELRRGDCLDRAARAAALAGDHDGAVALLDELLDDPTAPGGLASAKLAARAGSSSAAAGRMGEAGRRYHSAAALLPDTGAEAERAEVLAGYAATLLQGLDFAGARSVAGEALTLARTAGTDMVEARILGVLGFSSAYLDDTEAGVAALHQAVLVAERTGEPEAIREAYLRRAELLSGPLNRLVEGIELARAGVERTRALGLQRTAGVALQTYAANALFRLGRWDDAAHAVTEAWELGPTGSAALDVRLASIRLQIGRGDLDPAAADLKAVDLLARTMGGPRQRIPLLTLYAALDLWRADPAEALRHVEDGLAVAEAGADDIWALAPLVWHGTWAWADVVASGKPSPAPEAVARLREHTAELSRRASRTVPAVRAVVEAFTLMCEAETTRAEQRADPAIWERVVASWEQHRQPYPAAYGLLRQAEALLTLRPRASAGAAVLREAHRAAGALGARPLLHDIVDLARRCRIELTSVAPAPPESAPPGPLEQLTARELQVLAELAEGRTNREIAERLFISQKTVGVHLSRVFTKLDVHTRVQASTLYLKSRPPGEL